MSGFVSGGTSPYTYHWSSGATIQQANNLPVGFYTLTVTDIKGCTITIGEEMKEAPQLTLDLTPKQISCRGVADGALSVVGGGGLEPYSFMWNTGQSSPDLYELAPGTYQVTLTDAIGCTLVRSAMLFETYIPIASLSPDNLIYLGDFLNLSVSTSFPPNEIAEFMWFGPQDSSQCANCARFQFQPTENGCCKVVVRDTKGCIASDTICYLVEKKRQVYFPSVFSPDDDGTNDRFTVYSDLSVAKVKRLSIFNRWGELVFQSANFQPNDDYSGWDGSFKGKMANNEVLIWNAEIEFIDGITQIYSGDVTIVR
jgi:gliding motility-associated-like protein